MCSQRMQVGNHEITCVIFLHPHIVVHSAEVIAKVQESGRADATHYNGLHIVHKDGEDKDSSPLWICGFNHRLPYQH